MPRPLDVADMNSFAPPPSVSTTLKYMGVDTPWKESCDERPHFIATRKHSQHLSRITCTYTSCPVCYMYFTRRTAPKSSTELRPINGSINTPPSIVEERLIWRPAGTTWPGKDSLGHTDPRTLYLVFQTLGILKLCYLILLQTA